MSGVKRVVDELSSLKDAYKASHDKKFFKCVPNGYGDINDEFLGIGAKEIRGAAKKFYKKLSLSDIETLLQNPFHDIRVTALVMLTNLYDKADIETKKNIVEIYLGNTKFINNWDLVDVSVYKILGRFCFETGDYSLLHRLSESKNLWEQRMSVVANWSIVKKGEFTPLIEFSTKFLTHKHDLMHKAVGWILREMGKSSPKGHEELIKFLEKHKDVMPRTAFRYAIERLTPAQKAYFMGKTDV